MQRILFLLLIMLSTLAFGSGKKIVFQGKFQPFAESSDIDMNIRGKVTMKTGESGAKFKLHIEGLDENEMYVSHVHAQPCSVDTAGGHYKFDPSVSEAREENEIWFVIPAHKTSAKIKKSVDETIRPDAKSVVIHRMKGEKMLKVSCADLISK